MSENEETSYVQHSKRKRPATSEAEKGPGRPMNTLICPVCGTRGGALCQSPHVTRRRSGKTYTYHAWRIQHERTENGKVKQRVCYLGVNPDWKKLGIKPPKT